MGPLERSRFYDQVAGVYDRQYAYTPRHSLRQAAWLARQCPPGRLLDLGCGTGRMLAPLAKAGFAPVGLDCSPAMLAQCRQAGAPALVQADAAQGLPFASQSFAAVISLHATLIHLTAPGELEAALAEAKRVLMPHGRLVVELPHPASFPPVCEPRGWRDYQSGMSCRNVGRGLEEMRLDDYQELTTLVRVLRLPDVQRLFQGWRRVEVHPGFRGGKFRLDKGEVIVVLAEK
ncbi:MAG: methyltransferase domain-containing protein [Desulfarculaceae bacterium]|nr:methyltransferase domain-containing protein [Desulfarculaceae bacterium]MCF8071758.1 methyltransferase domain-containing protein [Desulfarculaceae bacterium]MCF8101308.1 methyltransferase domain-containing protein [Desulfarculaceae bacterium]MCF8117267.1 methyltransferase domain-containing protein [Desulfarculaceae bacterium]